MHWHATPLLRGSSDLRLVSRFCAERAEAKRFRADYPFADFAGGDGFQVGDVAVPDANKKAQPGKKPPLIQNDSPGRHLSTARPT